MTKAHFRRIRVRKQDSAFIYALLEASEGMATYSTINHRVGEMHRDLELIIPDSYMQEFEDWLKSLGDMILALPDLHGDQSNTLDLRGPDGLELSQKNNTGSSDGSI